MKDVVLSRNVEYFSVRKIDISYQNQIGSSNHKIKFSNTLISDSGYIQPNQSFSFYLFIFFEDLRVPMKQRSYISLVYMGFGPVK